MITGWVGKYGWERGFIARTPDHAKGTKRDWVDDDWPPIEIVIMTREEYGKICLPKPLRDLIGEDD